MAIRNRYNTRQRRTFLGYFESHPNTAYSAHELIEHHELNIGEATVYRLLAELSKTGVLTKLPSESGKASRYRYNNERPSGIRYVLKCKECGGTVSASCGFLSEFNRHMGDNHDFYMDPEETVLYGLCKDCHSRRK